ncbi:hypothetical protein [Pelagibacterium limicola]|uniref:hypothetical protein n=1 Tax=Pelagibacterium limicola TaxID=2791022 RepID=UPI0018AFA898|nr:hypothetical protein [Pelagibacterium limicola]
MRRPRLEAPWFGELPMFQRLAAVLEMTAREHCSGWDIAISNVPVEALNAHAQANRGHIDNTQKMEQWNAIIQAARPGEHILLIDADTFIVNSLDAIWDAKFDLAYTAKISRFPFNSGVIAVRVSDAVKAFFTAWAEVNRRMLLDNNLHAPWRRTYGGINQAAFGHMLKGEMAGTIEIEKLPCAIWNCEESAWEGFDPATTRIVHVKGAFRRALFDGSREDLARPGVRNLIGVWSALEERLNGQAA